MRSDKMQLSSMTTRQKVTAVGLVLVVIFIIWQVYGLFGGGGSTTPAPTVAANHPGGQAMGAATAPRPPATPQPTELIKPQPQMTQREIELERLQQETQAKYIAALNELQVLRVSRDIAETNQAIMAAKLATVTAEKNIVNILSPTQPQLSAADYARGLANQTGSVTQTVGSRPATPSNTQQAAQPREGSYTAISVSQLQYRWSAVLGYQGNLYNVHIGDVLPPDGSRVISIDKSGVTLEKNGERKKISMVPII